MDEIQSLVQGFGVALTLRPELVTLPFRLFTPAPFSVRFIAQPIDALLHLGADIP